MVAGICAALCACVALLAAAGVGTAAAARPGTAAALPVAGPLARPAALSYDPLTQSHPGACSRDTLDVGDAVTDLSANGVLGHYAALVGVHATGAALLGQMRRKLVVVPVASRAVTANHGCTTDGLIFPTGPRTLTPGEAVGVALSAKLRASLCSAASRDCERKLLTVHAVFPTNCWNLNQGTVRVIVHVRKPVPVKPVPKPKPKPTAKPVLMVTKPSARLTTTCGVGNAGGSTVTLANGSGANHGATFVLSGRRYGPVRPGHRITVKVALAAGTSVRVRVSSGGQQLLDQSVPADPCPASVPAASAVLSCSAGGVVVTLSNAANATDDASFELNGASYGPLAPGASRTVTVAVAPGSEGTVTVTSGGKTLLSGSAYSNSCGAAPSALAFVGCSVAPGGGGALAIQLTDGASAALPAQFTVTATGNTRSGYGPATVGPVQVGATKTLQLPVDASDSQVQVTVDSGGVQLFNQTFPGCSGVVGAG